MSAMATALFGSPLALQIYLIAHARKSDINISNFGWPVASLSSKAHKSLDEEAAGSKETSNAKDLEVSDTDSVPKPPTGKATSVSYKAVGRGLYRREIIAREESLERQLPTKLDKQELSTSLHESGQSATTPNHFLAKRLQEIRSEPKRYALSAATACAISQTRNDRFRKDSSVSREDTNASPKVYGLWSEQAYAGRNLRSSIEERKDSAALLSAQGLEKR